MEIPGLQKPISPVPSHIVHLQGALLEKTSVRHVLELETANFKLITHDPRYTCICIHTYMCAIQHRIQISICLHVYVYAYVHVCVDVHVKGYEYVDVSVNVRPEA